MKNKLAYTVAILFTVIIFTSCASRKYGCPNSTGMKVEKKVSSLNA